MGEETRNGSLYCHPRRKLRARTSRLLTPGLELPPGSPGRSPHAHRAEGSPFLRGRRRGSPHPHPDFLPCPDVAPSQSIPSKQVESQGCWPRPRLRRPPLGQRAMWQRWEKGIFRRECSQISPFHFPQQTKGKAATTITTQPDVQGASWEQDPWSQPGLAACSVPSTLSFASVQLLPGFHLQ